jgi:hypothetical protein
MVLEDQAFVLAEVTHDALALVEVVRDAFEVVIADPLVVAHGALVERQQAAVERRDRLARDRMGVQHGMQIPARHMDCAVNDEAGAVHLIRRLVEDVAVEIDLDQVRGGDLLIEEAVGVDQELILFARHAQRDVIVDQVRPAVMHHEAIGSRQIDAGLPLLVAHALAQ